MSAWDQNWQENFGGYDDPDRRNGYLPAGFMPTLNPFYIALPTMMSPKAACTGPRPPR